MLRTMRIVTVAVGALMMTVCAQNQHGADVTIRPAARNDLWTVIGPGGGGAQFLPSISPLDPNIVLVACDMGGGYISIDGGSSWRMFNLRGRIYGYGYDPKDPAILYAQSGGAFWRSVDRGAEWSMVYPDPGSITNIAFSDDEAIPLLMARGVHPTAVRAFATDPADSGVVYATFGDTLQVSRDSGKSWKSLHGTATTRLKRLYVDPRSPSGNRRVYAVGDLGVDVWDNGTFAHRAPPFGDKAYLQDIALGFPEGAGEPVVYAVGDIGVENGAYSGGLRISRDGGATWEDAPPSFFGRPADFKASPELQAIAVVLNQPGVAYLAYNHVQQTSTYSFGVAKTSDYGKTWEMVWKEAPQKPAANVHDSWLTARFGPEWGESPLALAVHPGNPNLCFGTDYGRTMRTRDGGATWEAVYSHLTPGGGYTTTGLDVTTSYEVRFDPHNPDRMFIAYTDIGLFRSEDHGATWQSATIGVPRPWRNTTYSVAFDPEVKDRMWGVMSQVHDMPRMKNFGPSKYPAYKGGVCRSSDGGKTWTRSNAGMDETAPTQILVDPRSPAGARVLYVAAAAKGVYKSVDDGKSWSLKRNGLPGTYPMAWRLAMDRNGILYLVTVRTSDDGAYGNDADGVLYRSRDGAETWEHVPLPAGLNGPTGIAIDPEDANRIYLSAWGRAKRYNVNPPEQGGVWLSTDAGGKWSNVLTQDGHVFDVVIDPHDRRVLYASGFESSVWRSADGGQKWSRVQGFNFHSGHRVAVDPKDAGTIYVTTYGGSVWKGPATGDPNAVEDILSPSVAYTRKPPALKRK
jgi:photosystem II stability/assembly factor-like uncharacterized protein